MEYAFQLRAVNRFGAGEPTEPIKVVTKCDVPSPPFALQCVQCTADSVMLRWSQPATDSGSEVVGYTLRMRAQDQGSWQVVTDDTSALAAEINGLNHSCRYDVSVRARNALGWSSWSEHITVETLPPNLPAAPKIVAACSAQGRATVCWRHEEVSPCECACVTLHACKR